MDTPASLLERLRRPDQQDAWARFVDLYTPLLYYWARRMGCQETDAADLVQEVLTLLVRKLPEFTYDRHRSFRSWLRTVTLNKWREGHRKNGGGRLETNAELPEPAAAAAALAFEESEYRQYLVQRALRALQGEFPVSTWKAFWEYAVVGRDAAEVAAELRLSVGSVYAAKSRALTRLRQELAGLLD
jgi:RNA polymerase sigma-70 factor (ECF subfamily)